MGDLRQKRTELVIFHTLSQLLRERLFSELTVNDIANASMIHRNTFYHHFADKYDLLRRFVLFGINDAGKTVNINEYSAKPFFVIHALYQSSYHSLFEFQRNDTQFMEVLTSSFERIFVKDLDDSENIWTIGAVHSIMLWNRLNGNHLDMFTDYDELDQIYQTHRFPRQNK